jgi:hypothetical protein
MKATILEDRVMAPKAQKTTPVRLTEEAIRWARIASGYTGESMAEYVSRVVAERGREDAERLHAEVTGGAAKNPKSKSK